MTDEPERDYAAEAEAIPAERARREKAVRAALKKGGLHLYPDSVRAAITELVELECVKLRKRIGIILDTSREHFEEGMTNVQLERQAFVVLCHECIDEEIHMPLDLIDEEAPEA